MKIGLLTQVHDALWDAVDRQRDSELQLEGRRFPIKYEDTAGALRARVQIDGEVFESQNLRKDSPFTRKITNTHRISWGFFHRSGGISWRHKIDSYSNKKGRNYRVEELGK